MNKIHYMAITTLLFGSLTFVTGCNAPKTGQTAEKSNVSAGQPTKGMTGDSGSSNHLQETGNNHAADNPTHPTENNNAVQVAANPSDVTVLVNKQTILPDGYKPSDLVEPNVPFIFKEKDERRLMRKEAAEALEKLFDGAKQDGIYLAGVSGYRSYETQKSLFDYYVKVQGKEVASKYSAVPGHSEHQTGLAMDVSGSDGKCAAADCFADTPEAKWLAQHASEYGFIIRYPKGKESITGYNYEPWHLRYVGIQIAREITEKGIALEQYYKNEVPVSK